MVRAAAKNHDHVGIVTAPSDYPVVLEELRRSGSLSAATRRRLARVAFAHTAAYDAAIVAWLDAGGPSPVDGADPEEEALGAVLPPTLHLTLERTAVLRYGENPHQRGSRYRTAGTRSWWDDVVQHGGKELSYLNLFDGDAAWRLVHELASDAGQPAVAIIKHANPCGAAVADSLVQAYERALEGDVQSAFGGVVAIGGAVTEAVAEAVAAGPQADVIIASSYTPAALERLTSRRKATRLLSGPAPERATRQLRSLGSSVLVQDVDDFVSPRSHWQVVTTRAPTDDEWRDLALAWRVGGRTTSNAIAIVNNGQAVGVGAGQQSRVVAAEIAVAKAGSGPRAGPDRATRSSPSPMGCSSWPTPASPPWSSRVDRSRTLTSLPQPTRRAWPWWSPANGTSATDARHLARRGSRRRRVRAEVADRVARLRGEGISVGLGTVLVGDDRPSERYVALKHEDCAKVGMVSVGEHLPETATQVEVEDVIRRFNADPQINAYLVQVPLPDGLDEERALMAVDPVKDVDGLHPVNLGRLVMGTPGPLPCTPAGIVELLQAYDVPVEGTPRGDHRSRPDHRPAARAPPGHEASGVQRGRHGRPHRCRRRRPGLVGAHRRHRGVGGGPGRAGDARHDQARCRRGQCRDHLGRQEAAARRPRGGGRGGRVDHAAAGGRWSHDTCHAFAQRRASRRAEHVKACGPAGEAS